MLKLPRLTQRGADAPVSPSSAVNLCIQRRQVRRRNQSFLTRKDTSLWQRGSRSISPIADEKKEWRPRGDKVHCGDTNPFTNEAIRGVLDIAVCRNRWQQSFILRHHKHARAQGKS